MPSGCAQFALRIFFYWGCSGMGQFYFDTRLPFRGRSSPFIFNSLADALDLDLSFCMWDTLCFTYLDDFFVASPRGNNFCSSYVQCHLSVPIADDKLEGSATRLTYLSIEIDSDDMVIRLPEEKLFELRSFLEAWVVKHKCTKRELLSLIGKLSFCCQGCQVWQAFRQTTYRFIDNGQAF